MNQVEQSVAEYVDEVWEDVVADIEQLVSYPSVAVAADAEPSAPFGRPVRDALDCALGIAQKLGYQTSDDEGYVGIADIPGRGDKQLATICHVDVVPAGPGWNTDPFAMERREGWLLGRGVIDDKGPAVLSLYAGAYLLKHGIVPRYTFRALLGCDEEVGMSDVHHYLENHADPDFLFTPDAEFPVCNAEKGQFGATFVSPKIDGGRIVSWSGAEASNAIPSQSICELAIAADELPAPVENADLHPGSAPVLSFGHANVIDSVRVTGTSWEVPVPRPIGDLVPQLDLGGAGVIPFLPAQQGSITPIDLPPRGTSFFDMTANHEQDGYLADVQHLSPRNQASVDAYLAAH